MLKTVNGGYLIKMGGGGRKTSPKPFSIRKCLFGAVGVEAIFGFPYLGFAANF